MISLSNKSIFIIILFSISSLFSQNQNVIISGNTGTGGVTLTTNDSTPKTTTSNGNGDYSIIVATDGEWDGQITPSKGGYTFSPPFRSYVETVGGTNQDYTATQIKPSITGNAGIGGVTLSWFEDRQNKTVTSKADGAYNVAVPFGWSGSVTPTKTGYIFNPINKSYSNVTSNQSNQNYFATQIFTISGNTGTGDATLTWEDGGIQTTTSDGSGNYSITVPSGWNGTVTPSKDGYTFSPESKSYVEVGTDKVNQDYIASLDSYTISGNTGTGDATLTWEDSGTQTTTSDSSGSYSISIPFGWNGTISPTKDGYTFDPVNKSYVEVGSDLENQDYIATVLQYIITAVANPEVGGTIDSLNPGGEYNNGETVLIIAIPNTGYQFVNWTLNGNEVSTDSSNTFVATANADYVANFELVELVIDCSVNPSDAGTTSGCGVFQFNDEITITAEANSGWVFTYWTEDGDTVSDNAEYTFTALSSRNLIANFDLISGIEKLYGEDIIPQDYYLSNAYPNPFNPETTIKFGIPEESNVSLMIFDITGQIVETVLNNSIVHAGNYANHFYADELPSGIYLYLLSANSTISEKNFKKTGKVLLLK